MFTRWKKKKGVTLVELALGLLLVTIIVGVVYALIKMGVDSWIMLSTRKALYQEGRAAIDIMLRELRHVDTVHFYWSPDSPEGWNGEYTGGFEIETNMYGGLIIGEAQHIQIYKGWAWGPSRSFLSSSSTVDYEYHDAGDATYPNMIVKYYPQGIWVWDDPVNWIGHWELLQSHFVIAKNVTAFTFSYGDYAGWAPPVPNEEVTWANTHNVYTPDLIRVQFTLTRNGQSATFSSTVAPRKKMSASQLFMSPYWWWGW